PTSITEESNADESWNLQKRELPHLLAVQYNHSQRPRTWLIPRNTRMSSLNGSLRRSFPRSWPFSRPFWTLLRLWPTRLWTRLTLLPKPLPPWTVHELRSPAARGFPTKKFSAR